MVDTTVPVAIVVHGGAADIPPEEQEPHEQGCVEAVAAGWQVLMDGGTAAGFRRTYELPHPAEHCADRDALRLCLTAGTGAEVANPGHSGATERGAPADRGRLSRAPYRLDP